MRKIKEILARKRIDYLLLFYYYYLLLFYYYYLLFFVLYYFFLNLTTAQLDPVDTESPTKTQLLL